MEAEREGFFRNAPHVAGIRRTFQTMNQDQGGRVGAGAGLPMAMAEDAAFFGDEEESLFGGRKDEGTGPEIGGNGHEMAVAEERVRFKGRQHWEKRGAKAPDRARAWRTPERVRE